MVILQLPQGYYGDCAGQRAEDAIASWRAADAAFLAANPGCAPYHQPSWQALTNPRVTRAPLGYVWYRVDDDGVLQWHSATYDSSD